MTLHTRYSDVGCSARNYFDRHHLGKEPGQSLSDWAIAMRKEGVPINDPQEVARLVVWLMSLGMEGNGKGCLIQAGRIADLEGGMAKTRKLWMWRGDAKSVQRRQKRALIPK